MALKSHHKAEQEGMTVFDELYARWYTPIFRFLSARSPNKAEAEDLVQTVFMKVWKGILENRVTQALPTSYIYTLAKNVLIDHWRKKKPEQLNEEQELVLPDSRPLISETMATLQESEPALKAILDLPAEQREVLMLRFFDELETKEIAALLHKNEAAVRQIQCRALKAVRHSMKQKTPA